ncbi:hypothetical protein ACSBR1_001946 [Camellia fascicularis]
MDEPKQKMKTKNFRKRNIEDVVEEDQILRNNGSDNEEEERRLALEEVKFLQKQRDKKWGIAAISSSTIVQRSGVGGGGGGGGGLVAKKASEKNDGDGEKDELVLQDTFAQETAVMVEDPNMLRYVEQELAKKRGKNVDVANQVENEVKHAEDELYKIPEHLKEKRRMGRMKTESSIPASYSADYFQRGRDYAEKLRRDHPELYKERGVEDTGQESRPTDSGTDAAGRRQAATDEFMLERFRKRERHRVMRR